jgi:hypothetical protein
MSPKRQITKNRGVELLRAAFAGADPRPEPDSAQKAKKNYAERLSRALAQTVADGLRPNFEGVFPDVNGKRHESRARTAKGFKRLDVNYSTTELGLGLGVSIKTINFRDRKSRNYRKNYTRVDAELRAEAKDYHDRQPYSVLVAVVCLPFDCCDDAVGKKPSSFGLAVKYFRHRGGRVQASDEAERFEALFIGLYEADGPNRGSFEFFDVRDPPKRAGRPRGTFDFEELIERISGVYDSRNDPPFTWDESE